MGYLPAALATIGTLVFAEVRGQKLPMRVAAMPFHPHSYKR
jgi:aminomethyltransferase